MRFQLTNLLALIPFVAGMALPEPAPGAQSLSNLASYETTTLADGATCLGLYMSLGTYYGPGNAGLPGCGVQRINRLQINSNSDAEVQQGCGAATCHFLGELSGYSYAGYNVCQTSC